ncbi:MAG: SDR family oxidoreductase [Bacteroidota bacterium]
MKYVLITGVSSGIGRITSEYLMNKGYFVFGSVRKPKDAETLQSKYPSQFMALHFDVTKQEEIDREKQKVVDKLNGAGLTALINNAGTSVSGPLLHIDIDKVIQQLNINVIGVVRVIQAFAPLVGAIKNFPHTPGRIVNISSIAGLVGNPFMGPYAASKHALEGLSDCLRRELMMYGVDVVLIEPGPIKSDIWNKAKADDWTMYDDTDYGYIIKKRQDVIKAAEEGAIPTEEVSKLILKAIELKKPKTRYLIASNKRTMWLAAYVLPDRVYDRLAYKNLNSQDKFRPLS